MRLVIGTKFRGHDASVFAVLPEERRIYGLSTERVTRHKHDGILPLDALRRVIENAKLDTHSVTEVVLVNAFTSIQASILPENLHTTETLLRKHFKAPYKKIFDEARAKFEQKSGIVKILDLLSSVHGWLFLWEKALLALKVRKMLPIGEIEERELKRTFPHATVSIKFFDHEYCHVISTLVTARFDELIALSLDGWGDGDFSKAYTYKNGTLAPLATSHPSSTEPIYAGPKGDTHVLASPGGVYTYVTEMLGFTPIADEGKVEALAAFGTPNKELYESFCSLATLDKERLSMQFDCDKARTLLGFKHFAQVLETIKKEDIAASVQKFLEMVTHEYVSLLVEKTGIKNLALAGGVAANVINNLNIYEHITPNLHITPAMADDGAAQGACYAYLLESGISVQDMRAMTSEMPYFGTVYTRDEVKPVLDQRSDIVVEDLGEGWPERTAELVAEGKIGAIFHGTMEWGPRALGNRSIIADPRQKGFRERINLHIKRRPAFQPFCPSILASEKDRLFESAYLNKHMTCAFRLKKEFWEQLPSAIHIDGTARAQFVEEGDNPSYFRLLMRVKELTGFGVVINTSFNKHGRTIVETPKDALTDFIDTDMDYIVIEGYLVTRRS